MRLQQLLSVTVCSLMGLLTRQLMGSVLVKLSSLKLTRLALVAVTAVC